MRYWHDYAIAWGEIIDEIATGTPAVKSTQMLRVLAERILDGTLPADAQVPPTRQIASRLSMGRNNVLRALSMLVDQGYLVAKPRSGFYVAKVATQAPRSYETTESVETIWRSRLPTPPIAKVRRQSFYIGYDIPFRGSGFDLHLFPANAWRDCEREAMSLTQISDWGRDSVEADDPRLISQLRTQILPSHGIWARPEEILITLGGQGARYLLARLLGGPGVSFGLEDPCLPDFLEVSRLSGSKVVSIPTDREGAIPGPELDSCQVAVLTPGHQFPTTAVMPLQRRHDILKRAEQNDCVLIEDTFETDLLDGPEKLATLKSIDRSGRVIFIGTLCRQMAPGLRIGYVVGHPHVIEQLRELQRLVHRHTPGNTQRALALFIERGHYRPFVRKARLELERRGNLLKRALADDIPEISVFHRDGTSSFWCELPLSKDGTRLTEMAQDTGLLVEAGESFFHTSTAPRNHLRLSVASVTDDQIVEGVGRLARLL
ncbi:GntR family transcriptional regulator/MocR family aminotransferase [Neorhizobium galegae]|uniref:aminotransferase-like domain-containing protein n=1 Tax=Neorhizobium galegae TaxID=399 RepID=UPI001AEB9690|nr:PLP-dependent aminotransferase family protein [Neorhizobium galegae]MBP2562194.1 GntR family transcriptional regulator/MocR family aminotransferase [Neorhizobium galegae]